MNAAVKTKIIQVGNSQGVRIPKTMLSQLGFGTEVEMLVESDHLVIRSGHHRRAGWGEQFREMAAQHDDRLLIDITPTWDESEWEW